MRSLTGRAFLLLFLTLLLAACAIGAVLTASTGAGYVAAVARALTILFVALVLSWLPFRTLDRRFRAMADAARSIASGDVGRRAPVDAHDEMAQLARALNEIADRFEGKLRELQAERDASRTILRTISIGVALVDKSLAIRYANARFWEMLAVDEPDDEPRLGAARQAVLEEMVVGVLRARTPVVRDVTFYLGERHEYEVTASPIGAYAGAEPEAILLTLEDLQPERALIAMRREFVANASHELKTPLTSIRGYAETLLTGGLEDEEHRVRFVETIRAQAERLEGMVDDLLALADLERPDAPLDMKEWDLGEIAHDLAAAFDDVATRRGLRLSVEARAGIRARVDRSRLELALRNLLDNAIKYTESGTVAITVEELGDAARIAVSDTGRGIEKEHLPRIFERFYRVDRGRSRARGGTGLGLSIVKHVALIHGGRVGVESEVGRGSVFCIEMPKQGPRPEAGRVTET